MKDNTSIETHYILSGRGPRIYNHEGNVKFRKLIEQRVPEYEASSKNQKGGIINNMLNEVHTEGMKFMELNKETGIWEEIEKFESRKKVGHGFRDYVFNRKRELEKLQNKDKKNAPSQVLSSVKEGTSKIDEKKSDEKKSDESSVVYDELSDESSGVYDELSEEQYEQIIKTVKKNALGKSQLVSSRSLAGFLKDVNFLRTESQGDVALGEVVELEHDDHGLSQLVISSNEAPAPAPVCVSSSDLNMADEDNALYSRIFAQVKKNAEEDKDEESPELQIRPCIVKRMTSNQNENLETKPDIRSNRCVKRAVFNRDKSMTSRLLKEKFAPMTLCIDTTKPTSVVDAMRSLSISKIGENNTSSDAKYQNYPSTPTMEPERVQSFGYNPTIAKTWSTMQQEEEEQNELADGIFYIGPGRRKPMN